MVITTAGNQITMKKATAGIFLCSALAACSVSLSANGNDVAAITTAPTEKLPDRYRHELNSEERDRAISVVRDALKDPDSANFKDLYKVGREGEEPTICGQVNAKNSYGGYIGFKSFYITPEGKLYIGVKDEFDAVMQDAYCNRYASPLG